MWINIQSKVRQLLGLPYKRGTITIPHSDERRVQNIQDVRKETEERGLYHTEKLDGQSLTLFYKRDEKVGLFKRGLFGICSRNIWYKSTGCTSNWTDMARQLQAESRLRSYCEKEGRSIAIQGEIIGLGIQGNGYKLVGRDTYFYNAYDIDEQRYLCMVEKLRLFDELGYKMVPHIGPIKSMDTEGYLEEAEAEESMLGPFAREGIVIRDLRDDSYSFKAISNTWLLQEK